MNTSQFMDKQIMEFSGLQTTGDLSSELLKPKEDHGHHMEGDTIGAGGGSGNLPVEEEIRPNYDFQLIRTNVGPQIAPPVPRPQTVESSNVSSSSKNYGLVEPRESSIPIQEQANDSFNAIMIAEIDRAVKNHTDNLLYSLEGISSRLAQLETRTHQLENSIDGLKVLSGETVGITDGKLRQLEYILIEIQTGIQALRGKQEIAEDQFPQLQVLASSDVQQLPAPLQQPFQQSSEATVPSQQHPTVPAFPPPQQSFQQPHQPTVLQQQHPAAPAQSTPPPVIPVPTPQQNLPVQFPGAVPQTQIPSIPTLEQQQSFPFPGQQQESTLQQYQSPVQQPPPQPHQQQHYQQSSHFPQYSPPTAQVQPPLAHNPEGASPYMLNQTYPPMPRPPLLSSQSPSGSPKPQFYGPGSNMYDPPTSKPGSAPQSYPLNYGEPPGLSFQEPHNYSASPSHYSMNSPPFTSSSIQSGGGSNYQRLPTAKVLPQATSVGSGSGGSTGNRVPIDDVVDKVATMGFSREQVRATVKKLTENEQSVDLNVVLDKLMNSGERGY